MNLANNIWTNNKEIPNNGIDDDWNGYIDDIHGWNFYDNNNNVYDDSNPINEVHGTHIAGVIAAEKNNGKGIAGVAQSAKIMPLKVFNNGKAYTSDLIDAINYAQKEGAEIVNCSWGSTEYNPALYDTIKESGMLFVCAAGNNGWNIDKQSVYPASFDCENIITVASLNKYGVLSGFSNYGETGVHVAAPGEEIQSTFPRNIYGYLSGTSIAAPFVAGEAALLLSINPEKGILNIKEDIIRYSDKFSSLIGKIYGGSKINCSNSLNQKESKKVIKVPQDNIPKENSLIQDSNEFSLFAVPYGLDQAYAEGWTIEGSWFNDSYFYPYIVGVMCNNTGSDIVATGMYSNNNQIYSGIGGSVSVPYRSDG